MRSMKDTSSTAATSSETSATSWQPTCGRRGISNATPECAPRSNSDVGCSTMCEANGGLRFAAGALLLLYFATARAGDPQVIQNAASRPGMTLAGQWHVIVDP